MNRKKARMNYKIEKIKNEKYITLTVNGDINKQLAMQMNLEAHRLGKKLGINKYLVDLRESRNIDNTLEQYNFAYGDMSKEENIDRTARVATLVSPNDHSHDFIEIVARNSGLNVTIFRNIEEAKKHLEK